MVWECDGFGWVVTRKKVPKRQSLASVTLFIHRVLVLTQPDKLSRAAIPPATFTTGHPLNNSVPCYFFSAITRGKMPSAKWDKQRPMKCSYHNCTLFIIFSIIITITIILYIYIYIYMYVRWVCCSVS